jgi:arylsulfatase
MPAPNVLLILNDDMGYSDLGCYGGEVHTPNLDRLAAGGLRFTQFYNTARCCPSRASLLTGLHPHQADVGHMIGNDQLDGYLGDLSRNSATIAEVLKGAGYGTYMAGKWHVTGHLDAPNASWPCQRGFDRYYGMLCGAGSYYAPRTLTRDNTPIEPPDGDFYLTDAISDEAVGQLKRHFADRPGEPFFQYVAYTAPHWPLHAREEDIAHYRGRYDCGWDALREQRLARMRELGLISEATALSPRDPTQPAWEDAPDKAWQARRMEVYAAQIHNMDAGIGRILAALEQAGQLDNTLVIFLADNGGCHEEIGGGWAERLPHSLSARPATRDGRPVRFGNRPDIEPGPEDTYCSYGVPWANVSNTPFRKYKSWIHEGGISTPFIVHWPEGIGASGALRRQPAQLPDVMATVVDVTGARYPERIGERAIPPHEGFSLRDAFADKAHSREVLTWEHEGNCGIRRGRWKLVREYIMPGGLSARGNPALQPGCQPWELYDIEADRSELHNLAADNPSLVEELAGLWRQWADRCKVQPWDEILRRRAARQQ